MPGRMTPQKCKPRLSFLAVLAICSVAVGATHRGKLVVEDFESFAWGGEWATVHCSPGADPRMSIVRDGVHSGEQACRLDVPPGESLTIVTQHGTKFVGQGDKPPLPLPGVPERIGLWVRGRQSGHQMWLRLLDANGKAADVELGTVNFEGWTLLEAKVPELAPPVGLHGLSVRGGRGPLVIDDVTVTTVCEQPLHVAVRPRWPDEPLVAGRRAEFRVVVQTVSATETRGRAEVTATGGEGERRVADSEWFRYKVWVGKPSVRIVRLRLDGGVYRLTARAGGAVCRRRVVVHPEEPRLLDTSPGRAIRRFGERGDALRVYESAFSPAVVVESRGDTVTLFRGLGAVGLTVPRDSLMRTKGLGRKKERRELVEPWLLVWFGAAPSWARVRFADGSPCPTFDVPFVVVLERKPKEVKLDSHGLRLTYSGRAGRVAVMPLYGVRRPRPSETTQWKEDVELLRKAVELCRFWGKALRAFPIGVEESWRADSERDEVEVRTRFSYLEWRGDWDERPLRVAPVPPLLTLAARAGLPVRFAKAPQATGCHTSVGPYMVVPDAQECTYTIRGVLHDVARAVSRAPEGGPTPALSLARGYQALSSDVPKIPFWARAAGGRGRPIAEALVRFLLWENNSRYEVDAASGRLRALDGLVWQTEGSEAAAAAVGEHLRGCWYAGFHAGLWDLLERRWRHVESLRETLRPKGSWATLGLAAGAPSFDAALNAEVFFARVAAGLGKDDACADSCRRIAGLLTAGCALVAGAPPYAREHAPWPSLIGQPDDDTPFGRCLGGSVGLAPGPLPFVTSPSDAGYGFASRVLGEYLRRRFRGGPLDYYGRDLAAWRQRRLVDIELPRLSGRRFRGVPREPGPYSGNFVCTVGRGPDGWPTLVWASHRAPKGGPLLLGGIGTLRHARGRLRRSVVASPHLRLSAYGAIRGRPSATEEESPQQP